MDAKNVKIIFLLPKECETELQTSKEMQQAYEACRQNGVNLEWKREDDCFDLALQKTDFIVFQTFEGTLFDKVRDTKSVRIVGPWCLLTCLTGGIPIPNYPWPLYSIAMKGCTVTCSSVTKPQRKELQQKIQYMAGYFSATLTDNCTHLVTDSVQSEKYIKAAKAGLELVLPSWVHEVWEASCKANVRCSDNVFTKYYCRPFHKLVVCCTGLDSAKRSTLAQLVAENGGTYRDQLHTSSTDILVCDSASTNTAKYKGAQKYNIACVRFQWVVDSIDKGYTMPVEDNLYRVKIGTSTPTKDGEDVHPNFSMISHIENSRLFPLDKTDFSDTINATDFSKLTCVTPVKESSNLKRKSNSNEHNDLVDEIDLKKVKQAGPFLDGCGIYLAGFGPEQREKLCKVLNCSGATRYDDVSERVTHVLVGDASCPELKRMSSKGTLGNCPLVTIHWLLHSITCQCPVEEGSYLVSAISNSTNEIGSPLSKKGLHLLRTSNTPTVPRTEDVQLAVCEPEPEIDIVQQYLCTNASSQEDTLAKLLDANPLDSKQITSAPQIEQIPKEVSKSNQSRASNMQLHHQDSTLKQPNASISDRDGSFSSAVDDSSQPIEPIYEGMKFIIVNFTEELRSELKVAIESMAGKVVSKSYKGIADYAVVPVFNPMLKQVATEIVTDLWISECLQENEVRPLEYFHRPIAVNEDMQPLQDCVVTISSYAGYERNFLKFLIIQLGGVCQEQFSRINSSKSSIVASTHLISPEASGRKYEAAIKWGLPVVTKDWLLECVRLSQLPSESLFLVGDAKCSVRRIADENTPSKDIVSKSNVTSTLSSPKPGVSGTSAHVDYRNSNTSIQESSSSAEHTPENRVLKNVHNLSNVCSQVTPVQKILAEARKQHLLGTPSESLPMPQAWDHVDTPDTPLGAFIRPNPSPNLRKQMVRFLNTLPSHKPRRESTPLSELKRRLWDKICPPKDGQNTEKPEQPNFSMEEDEVFVEKENSEYDVTPVKPTVNMPEEVVNNHLQQLQDMLASSGGNRVNTKNRKQSIIPVAAAEIKDSQPNTVGWDDCMECDNIQAKEQKAVVSIFMVSGLEPDRRDTIIAQLESLSGTVSNLSNFDPICTHLICPKPMRNEKVLACMAAGKWILHNSYVDRCSAEGTLVDEEEFEYGNPKARNNVYMQGDKENETRQAAVHYWRTEIARRGYGPFHDMRLIVIAPKRDSIVRILQAGGGMVVEASPPFTQQIHATHCLLDLKSVTNMSDYIPLAKQGIFCVSTLYVSEFLQRTVSDVRDRIVPGLAQYYT